MREDLLILFVAALLAASTAVKYRKQIRGIIGFARMLKDAKHDLNQMPTKMAASAEKSTPLVNCSKCGVWIPQNRAIKIGELFHCSNHTTAT
jgi:hypothetical protein